MYSISIAPVLPPRGNPRAYEFYNDASLPVFLTPDSNTLKSLEGYEIPTKGDFCLLFSSQVSGLVWRHSLVNGHVSLSQELVKHTGDSPLKVYLNRPKGKIGLVVRTYQYGKVDTGRRQTGWARIADTCFSLEEMSVGVCKPSFSRSDLFYMEDEVLRTFKGYDTICVAPVGGSPPRQLELLTGHDTKALELVSEYATKEHHVLHGIPLCASTLKVPQHMHPSYYYVPSLPILPGVSSANAYVTSAHSFYTSTSNRVVTNEWLLARLNEVLVCRGITHSEFIEFSCKVHQGKDPGREALNVVNHVLRMHTTSRPYVVDHTWVNRKITRGDQETSAFHLPGDCEDSSMVVYKLHMQVLFGCTDGHPLLEALRTCAILLGVPCAIAGTFVDPLKVRDEDEFGHVFPCAIPFCVFATAIGASSTQAAKEFQRVFKFEMPTWHTRIAVLEGVFRTTMFYSTHRHVSDKKKKAIEETKRWLINTKHEDGDEFWCWERYTVGLPLDLDHRAHGHAYRLFTEVLEYVKLGEPSYLNGQRQDAKDAECCSFMITSNLLPDENPDEILKRLFPGGIVGGDKTKEYVKKQVEGCQVKDGCGIPIDFLVGDSSHPVFSLKGILPLPMEVKKAERRVRASYDRPLVPLVAYPPDGFMNRPTKVPRAYHPPPTTPGVMDAKLDSNSRLTLYAYDVDKIDVEDLKKRLGARNHYTCRYAFSTAIIIPLV